MLARLCGAVVAAIAALSLLGWALQLDLLTAVIPGLSTMKANTAVAFLACAVALFCSVRGPDTGRIVAAAIALLLGAIALAEYASGADFGIDQMLFVDTDESGHAEPGRMSLVTAFNFALAGVAFILPRDRTRSFEITFAAVCMVGLTIGFLVLTGYAFGARLLTDPIPQSSIAVNTALCFVLVFVGALASRPGSGVLHQIRQATAGGIVRRRLLPWVVIMPPVLGWLILWGAERDHFDLPGALALFAVVSVLVLVGVVWRGADAADRLQAALIEQEELHQTVIDTALDAFVLMDQSGNVLAWNPQAEQIFGWRRDEALGRPVSDLILPRDARDGFKMGLRAFLETGKGPMLRRLVEMEATRRDGEHLPVELVVVPMQQQGRWLFSAFIRDVSARRAAEEQLNRSQRLQAVGQLTGGVAHDFNNLLTIIIGNTELMLEDETRPHRDFLGQVLRAAENGAKLTRSMLAFSRQQPLTPERLDVNAFVEGMTSILRRTLGAHIDIQLHLAADLHQTEVDRVQLENALLNLAINARDAMPEGGKLTIETSNVYLDDSYAAINAEVEAGEYVMLAVTDTGAGMPPEVIARAMEPFFTTKPKGSGTGLGLSMIYGFAKQSRGHLKIYSEPGSGTTVRLYMQIAASEAPETQAAEAATAAQERGDETILLVEDDAGVRAFAAGRLRDLGYTVIEAADGDEGERHLDDSMVIDLLFTDVVLPGTLSGRQLAEAAIAKRPALRVLFTSGYTENSIVHQGRLDPGVHLLSKPYGTRQLAAKVREVLAGGPFTPG